MKDTIIRIGYDNCNSEVLKSKSPSLLAYIYRDRIFPDQIEILKTVKAKYGNKLNVCVMNGDFKNLRDKYNIMGSPTYIIFFKGIERGRMLGKAYEETLKEFVDEILGNIENSQQAAIEE
jgi:hypothetical protein